jgi:hypothetical protein
MTSFVRTSFASLSTTCAFVALLGLAAFAGACGGDDDPVVVPDAAVDAAIDAPIDAPPLVCNAPTMNCGGMCVNTNTNSMYCGNCTTMCSGGRTCNTGTCACPNVTIMPSFAGGIGGTFQGILLGASDISGNALIVVADPVNTVENMDYTMSEANLGMFPTAGFGVGVDLLAQTADASFAATEGTLRITKMCPGTPNAFPPDGGIMGTLTNVKFSAVDGLFDGNPMITPGGCTLPPTGTIASISFSLGDVSCTPAAQ